MTTTLADVQRLATILERVSALGDAIGEDLTVEVGSRFIRVVISAFGSRSVHAFVDRTNGDLIKASGWKAPQKGVNGLAVRGNLLDAADFARILSVADKYGSYLYAR